MDGHIAEVTLDLDGTDGRFGLLQCGPSGGPLLLCLHGFPDTAWSFRHLLLEAGAVGMRAVAPFLRGYAPTSFSPKSTYPLALLIDDAVRLQAALGGGDGTVLVGHDWGAAIAYGAAAYAPGRFRSVVGLAVPPAGAFARGLFTFEQLRRSFYIFFFQMPFADAIVADNDLAFLEHLWRLWSPGYDPSEELSHLRQALPDAQHLAAALGYYRAMFDPAATPPELADRAGSVGQGFPQPLLYMHGRDDGCFGADLLERNDVADGLRSSLAQGSAIEIVEAAGHFLHLERPELVNKRILEWAESPTT